MACVVSSYASLHIQLCINQHNWCTWPESVACWYLLENIFKFSFFCVPSQVLSVRYLYIVIRSCTVFFVSSFFVYSFYASFWKGHFIYFSDKMYCCLDGAVLRWRLIYVNQKWIINAWSLWLKCIFWFMILYFMLGYDVIGLT